MTTQEMILAVQRKLGVEPDGNPGPNTWTAIYNHIVSSTVTGRYDVVIDSQSERNIATLLPLVRPLARSLIFNAAQHGFTIRVISAMRTYTEQDDLYAQGRTAPGKIVTKAPGGFSNHNFGIAFDIGIFKAGKYVGDGIDSEYAVVGAIGKSLGLSWGGDWQSIVDLPHFELRPEWAADMSEHDMLAELRRRKATGEPVFS